MEEKQGQIKANHRKHREAQEKPRKMTDRQRKSIKKKLKDESNTHTHTKDKSKNQT
jgi:hypothetical protein